MRVDVHARVRRVASRTAESGDDYIGSTRVRVLYTWRASHRTQRSRTSTIRENVDEYNEMWMIVGTWWTQADMAESWWRSGGLHAQRDCGPYRAKCLRTLCSYQEVSLCLVRQVTLRSSTFASSIVCLAKSHTSHHTTHLPKSGIRL